jgi:hypothetical protein
MPESQFARPAIFHATAQGKLALAHIPMSELDRKRVGIAYPDSGVAPFWCDGALPIWKNANPICDGANPKCGNANPKCNNANPKCGDANPI